MRPITADPDLVACCGLYCGACKAFLKEKCLGCRKSSRNGWCAVKKCTREKGIATCAECGEHTQPMDCRKFNNFISRMFGIVFNSDRGACIEEVRQLGLKAYAAKMAERERPTIPRSR